MPVGRRLAELGAIAALVVVGTWVAVQLTSAWEPSDAGSTGHATAVRYVGLALAGLVLAVAGHRRLFVLPALAVYGVPLLFGLQLDLSGDWAETSWGQMLAEVALVLVPAATVAWLRRGRPVGELPSATAAGIGAAALTAIIVTFIAAEQPYPHVAQVASGQAVAVAIVTTLLARRPRLVWSVAVLPLLLWHEPLVEVLYLTRASYGPVAREYYALAGWALVAGAVAPMVDVLRHLATVGTRRSGVAAA